MITKTKKIIERKIRQNGDDGETLLSRRIFFTAGFSDRGLVRQNNEDDFLITEVSSQLCPQVFICAVADGMGGHEYGEVASSEAVRMLREESARLNGRFRTGTEFKEWLENVIHTINASIRVISNELQAYKSIGSTLVASMFAGQKAYVANVGDSRAYLLRQGSLRQITTDHSFVGLLVDKKLISPEEIYTHPRRAEITRRLGQAGELNVDLFELDIFPGDALLLCSDGLWEMVRDNDIRSILHDIADPADACRAFVERANQAGGTDNITSIVVKVEELMRGY